MGLYGWHWNVNSYLEFIYLMNSDYEFQYLNCNDWITKLELLVAKNNQRTVQYRYVNK